jgi:chromosome segregation ATPase
MLKKLKEEAIARGLTESPSDRESRETDSATALGTVSLASTKDELLAFVRQQQTVVLKLRSQIAANKEVQAQSAAETARLERLHADSQTRVAALSADLDAANDRNARHAAQIDSVTAARDDARLRLHELRLQAVQLEQQLHESLATSSTARETSSDSAVQLELARLRDARIAADAARSTAEHELASTREQLARAESALVTARVEFGSAVVAATAAATTVTTSTTVPLTSIASETKSSVPVVASVSADTTRISELTDVVARMAANDARQTQLLATLERRVERQQLTVDEATRRAESALADRDLAVTSADKLRAECAQLRAALDQATLRDDVVDVTPQLRAEIIGLETELRDARRSIDEQTNGMRQLQASLDEARAELSALAQTFADARQENAQLAIEKQDALEQVAQLRKTVDETETICEQKAIALTRLKAQLADNDTAAAAPATATTTTTQQPLPPRDSELQSLLAEQEEMFAMQVALLKHEINELNRAGSRRDVDLHVLKNAVLKLFGMPVAKQEGFVRVLGGMLSFSPLEIREAMDAIRSATTV